MQHVTIIPGDRRVYVDGASQAVDCSDMDPSIHAVQWSEANQAGEIEYVNDPYGSPEKYRPNRPISSIADFQRYLDRYNVAAALAQSTAA